MNTDGVKLLARVTAREQGRVKGRAKRKRQARKRAQDAVDILQRFKELRGET